MLDLMDWLYLVNKLDMGVFAIILALKIEIITVNNNVKNHVSRYSDKTLMNCSGFYKK